MLTRLIARGFKNLDVDVQLGPFTCIAGPNGVGKSNVFDAIAFLSALAGKPLLEAALDARGGAGRMGDVRGIFRRAGERQGDKMMLAAEMIIPPEGEDQLGQIAEASITYLRYEIALRHEAELPARPNGGIQIESERLTHLNITDAKRLLGFPTSAEFRASCIKGRRTVPYISTTSDGVVLFHADAKGGKGGGGSRTLRARDLPRTVLSTAENAAEHRTATLARREMLSWTQLHLEPSALRAPDDFTAPGTIAHNGAHLPAALYRLVRDERATSGESDVSARVANRLSQLIEQVRSVAVDLDEKRQLLSIVMVDRNGTPHLASSLSDGTLRFLALAVMSEETEPRALLCLEEPENGMHPSRVPAMLGLLKDLAVDPHEPVGPDNPLRQVIINTHSPAVVTEVLEDELLMAKLTPAEGGAEIATLLPLSATWRPADRPIAKGDLLAYLDQTWPRPSAPKPEAKPSGGSAVRPRRVIDRSDLQVDFLAKKPSAAE